jgi:Na+-transporting methylmalonyl-CoA/oxaloacetate decarboxylase gamma subunit
MAAWWSHVQGTATQGLQITFVGMSLVFLTLGLIIITMVVLTRLPGLRSAEAGQEDKETSGKPVSRALVVPPPAGGDELERVAAIAVAVIRSRRRSRRASKPRIAANAWKQGGRARQLGL